MDKFKQIQKYSKEFNAIIVHSMKLIECNKEKCKKKLIGKKNMEILLWQKSQNYLSKKKKQNLLGHLIKKKLLYAIVIISTWM